MIPVDALPPKARAERVTKSSEIPLIPDLEIPTIKAAPRASPQLNQESWKASVSSIYDCILVNG